MPIAWRIVKRKHAGRAFDGEGARANGGRWNSPGVSVVYGAEGKALAAMEILVHLQSAVVLDAFVAIPATFADTHITPLEDIAPLPDNWLANPAPYATRAIGDEWVSRGASLILRVPSVVVPGEWNYLINPAHPDMTTVEIGSPEEFPWDDRLFQQKQ